MKKNLSLLQVVVTMSDVWRIFVVEGEEALNRSLVTSLSKDGYVVQGVTNGADAVRALWSEEYDVVICDLNTPGADGFELLEWLRLYRTNTRMIIMGAAEPAALRMQALGSGAVSYLEKPLDFRILKEELRRLLQQTGFSANLDSFDLLDVIQVMSRSSITLLVNIGLEERGVLRFQNGELVWAEYGVLLGEEAFFALAAHKNGTIVHQPWNEQVIANVTQPLSRLIFQALQYREKYAERLQYSGEIDMLTEAAPVSDEDNDRPFVVFDDSQSQLPSVPFVQQQVEVPQAVPAHSNSASGSVGEVREWWEQTGHIVGVRDASNNTKDTFDPVPFTYENQSLANNAAVSQSSQVHKTPDSQRAELPSWLTDQPTSTNMPAVHPSSLSQSAKIPTTPPNKISSPEWQAPLSSIKTSKSSPAKQPTPVPGTTEWSSIQPTPYVPYTQLPPSHETEWQVSGSLEALVRSNSGQLQFEPIVPYEAEPVQDIQTFSPAQSTGMSSEFSLDEMRDSNQGLSTAHLNAQRTAARRNYTALVSALQTLGYSIIGFIAAAVVSIEGQPIAQVAVDDLDISRLCRHFSMMQKSVLQILDQGNWGGYEETIITSTDAHILMRVVGSEKKAFQVLITTREANPVESLEVMANVEGAISAALR